MSNNYVSIEILSKQLGMDRSNARKWILDLGYKFFKVRSPIHHQLMIALTEEDANKIIETRKNQGFENSKQIIAPRSGMFYIMRLCPDISSKRIKLGYTTSLESRIIAHRTVAPTAELIMSWPCKDYWEKSIIDCITSIGCKSITNEVYDCENVELLVERAKQVFKLMPKIQGEN